MRDEVGEKKVGEGPMGDEAKRGEGGPWTLPLPWVRGSGNGGASVVGVVVEARAAAGESRGLRRRGTLAVPVGRDTPAVPDGTPAVPDGMKGGTTGGGRGGRGRRGHPLFVPGEGDEQGKGQGREE